MSKIEAGQMTLNEHDFDLFSLLDSLEEMLQLKARSKGLRLLFDLAAEVPQYVYTDESKLRQVLINLLGNAIKFTQTGSVILRVRILEPVAALSPASSDPALPLLKFEVEDTGVGIAAGELERLFEAFVQAESGRKSQEGTGLGLPISRQFIRLMGGDITVNSTLGQGSLFRFEIPIQAGVGSAILPVHQFHQRVIGLAAEQPTYRILVVEDKWENRQLLVKLLTGVGFAVQEATNGLEAVALWESWQPHLIWMDMKMPILDGYTATQQIRQQEQSCQRQALEPLTVGAAGSPSLPPSDSHLPKRTVIIALTAHAFEEDRETVMATGCDDFITKPFREEVLFAKMSQYLQVAYRYEAVQDSLPSPSDVVKVDTYRPLLETLSPTWRTEAYQAAIRLADLELLNLVEQLPDTHTLLASALKSWLAELRLDLIIELFQEE